MGGHKRARSGGEFGVVPSSLGPGFFNRSDRNSSSEKGGKGAWPPPTATISPASRAVNCRCGFLNRQGQPLIRTIISRSTTRTCILSCDGSFRSEASPVFPSSIVSGGFGSVSGSHSHSTDVGLGGGVRRTPSGMVRQWQKSWTRKLEDERRE